MVTRDASKHNIKVIWNFSILDFVELPSQVMENWCYEPELGFVCNTLPNGRNHTYRISSKIKESSNFQEGMATMRQLSFGLLDMGWHGQDLRLYRY
jgi:peptidyl-dipeptidase Dcp